MGFYANLKVFPFGLQAFKGHMRNQIPSALLENSLSPPEQLLWDMFL